MSLAGPGFLALLQQDATVDRGGVLVEMKHTDRDAAIADLDEKSRSLSDTLLETSKAISRVASIRNILIPLHRLPDELLAEIFFYAAETSPASLDRDLVRLINVCSRWRFVALLNGKLWSRIIISHQHLRWVRGKLLRSRLAPLDITICCDDTRRLRKVASLLAPHSDRIRGLHIYQGLVNPKFPLRLLVRRRMRAELFPVAHWDSVVTKTFGERLPSLQSLTLDCVRLTWASPIYSDLVYLRLHGNLIMPSSTFAQLLALLERSPRLRSLTIEQQWPVAEPSAGGLVELPHLQHLSLSYLGRSRTVQLLSCLKLQPGVSIHLADDVEPPVDPPLPPGNRLAGGCLNGAQVLDISMDDTLQVVLRKDAAEPFADPVLHARWEWNTFDLLIPSVPSVVPCLDCSQLRTFTLSGIHVFDGSWERVLRPMLNLQTIRLVEVPPEIIGELIDALKTDPAQDSIIDCPLLTELEFVNPCDTMSIFGIGNFIMALEKTIAGRSSSRGGSLRSVDFLEFGWPLNHLISLWNLGKRIECGVSLTVNDWDPAALPLRWTKTEDTTSV